MADIAKICGVSKATVSRVINNNPNGVSVQTKNRILKTIEELNYRPNLLARGIAASNSRMIGLIIPDIGNLFFPSLVRGVDNFVASKGYNLLLCNTDHDQEKEKEALISMVDHRAEGVILVSGVSNESFLEKYKEYGMPLVMIGRSFDKHLSDASVTGDNVKGADLATQYFIDSGNKNIAYFDGVAGVSGSRHRMKGYRNALERAGREFNPILVKSRGFSVEAGIEMVTELINDGTEVDAILAGSDLIGIGVVKGLFKLGIKVPEEIEVIGFDDIALSRIFEPQLSSVFKPHYEIARQATRFLFERINGTLGDLRHITVDCTLKLRQTTRNVVKSD